MSKFKVGDVVQRESHRSDITKYLGCGNNGAYTVTDVNSLGNWIQLDGWDDAGKDRYPWYFNNFVLAESDELPPAPESVMYFNSIRDEGNDQCITVRYDNGPYYAGTLCISVLPRGDYAGYKSVVLDPDAVLQLAHDLRRMAMSIKKKGKQDAAK